MAIRVPTPNVSLVDLVFNTERPVSVAAINEAIAAAAAGPMKGILKASFAPIVSTDLIGDSHSSIFDMPLTATMGDYTGKILTWYDNEWGFSSRMVDLAKRLGDLQ